MKIIPLSEGSFTVDKTKVFVPFDENTENIKNRPVGSLLVEVQPFVVITRQDVILLDAGLGFSDREGTLQLHRNLMDKGINPSEVTRVLMSHLHKDHSGGVGRRNGAGVAGQLSFPGARYYVQRKELELALGGTSSSYITDDLQCLRDAPQVELLDGSGSIDDHITYEITSAHSPHHQVFWIRDADEVAFFGGDDAPQYNQMKKRYVAKYDYDGKKCMELRQQWWQQGSEEHWSFLFYHDVKTPVVRP